MALPHPFFILFLSFLCLSTSTLAASPHTVVDIRNDLPINMNVQLELRCDKAPSFYLKQGQHYSHTLIADQDFECNAVWLPLFATWDAYLAQRDNGHFTVYWSVRKDGFYQSWDGSNWKLLQGWSTE